MKAALLAVLFSTVLAFGIVPNAFAQYYAEVSVSPGSSVPGCEEYFDCYYPFEVFVNEGGEVTWYNDDSAAHTVTHGIPGENWGEFDSSLFMAGTTFSMIFDYPGEYPYYCVVHPWMVGVVYVEDSGNGEYDLSPTRTSYPSIFFDYSDYNEGDFFVLTVYDDFANFDPFQIDSIEVGFEDGISGEIFWGHLDETGPNTGEFVLSEYLPDFEYDTEIRMWYEFDTGDGYIDSIYASAFVYDLSPTRTSYPSIFFDYSDYNEGDFFVLTVYDDFANFDPFQIDSIEVGFEDITSGEMVWDSIFESGPDTGEFVYSDYITDIPYDTEIRVWYEFDTGDGYIDSIYASAFVYAPELVCGPNTELINGVCVSIEPDPTPLIIPRGTDIVAEVGSSVPGCEKSNSCYSPYKLYVKQGDSVTWFNADSAAHTVTSGIVPEYHNIPGPEGPDGIFDSSLFMSGSSFSHTFNKAGSYPYFCMVHPWMVGFIEVESTISTPIIRDTTPPKILSQDIVEHTTSSSGTNVNFSDKVKVIDDEDGVLSASCIPRTGSFFKVGTTTVKCTATDSSGNTGVGSFLVTVKAQQTERPAVPSWVKNVAGWYCSDEVDEKSFVEGLQYLINNDVITVGNIQSGSSSGQSIPQWIKNNACWWSQGQIAEKDFLSGIEYLIKEGIIRI